MYQLRVFKRDEHRPHHVENVLVPSDAFKLIRTIMSEHAGCERLEVWSGTRLLFSMDCNGNTTVGQ